MNNIALKKINLGEGFKTTLYEDNYGIHKINYQKLVISNFCDALLEDFDIIYGIGFSSSRTMRHNNIVKNNSNKIAGMKD